jgi:hypothetical protein
MLGAIPVQFVENIGEFTAIDELTVIGESDLENFAEMAWSVDPAGVVGKTFFAASIL